jgi:hypothetical protein
LFGSANAGTDSVPTTVFATGLDDAVLANAFKTDMATIQKIKAALAYPRLELKFSSSPPSVEIVLLSAFSSFLILARQDYDINYLAE